MREHGFYPGFRAVAVTAVTRFAFWGRWDRVPRMKTTSRGAVTGLLGLGCCIAALAVGPGCSTTTGGSEPTATPTPETTTPNPTPTETPVPQIKYTPVRGILHVHSAYSHDGCDGEIDASGTVDTECINELRDAACDAGLDFVALTDHPSHVSEYPMAEVLLHDTSAGDVLMQSADGPIANVVTCADGHTVTYTVGYEGSPHLMPLAIQKALPPELYEGLEDNIPMATSQANVAGLKDHGAFVAVAHSEEDDLSGSYILDSGADGMEWYNPHANFTNLISPDLLGGSDPAELIDRLGSIQAFLLGADEPAPHPDLVYLALLQSFPVKGLEKWREVQLERPVVGLFGSDVHRNVSIDPICTDNLMPLCELAAAAYPHVLTSLIAGGTIDLVDGDRIDSYARVLRLEENRVLVEENTLEQWREGLAAGRVYGVFTVFGDPSGFELQAVDAEGYKHPIGSSVADADHLEITNPVPKALGGAPFTAAQAADAVVTTRLLRLESSGPVLVAESTDPGETWTQPITEAGIYYVEVWIQPKHLLGALGSETDLADPEYLWVITNPIRVP